MFNSIMDFLNNRSIQVKIATEISRRCLVENGTPQGSVISPLLFNIIINEVFFLMFNQGLESYYLQMMVAYEKGGKM